MAEKFPEVQGGGSLILAWQVRNKKVLVVGGGEVCEMPLNLTSNDVVNVANHHRLRLAES